MSIKTPVLFISHGAPTFALEPGLLGTRLKTIGEQLNSIKSVLVISPHWQTQNLRVMTNPKPKTYHDFSGFPAALYQLQYPVSGQPQLAKEILQLLTEYGYKAVADDEHDIDHGVWVPLLHLLPDANIPVVQISMPVSLNASQAIELGQSLSELRSRGVMMIGSGSLTHNLYDLRPENSSVADYVRDFTEWMRARVLTYSLDELSDYRKQAPYAEMAHPTDEHLLPLLFALGASGGGDVQVLSTEVNYGVISMESYAWGL